MTRRLLLPAALLAMLMAYGCGDTVTTPPGGDDPDPVPVLFDGLEFGTATTLDVVTWNLKTFPYNEDDRFLTVHYAAAAIRAMEADVAALQEISQGGYFDALADSLAADGYDAHRAVSDSFSNLAYLWRTETVTDVAFSEPLDDGRPYPRYPLFFEIEFDGIPLTIINNHFKAFGDGYLDDGDEWDEETRRADASEGLEAWIRSNAQDRAVILLGDLNDLLMDPPEHNVFQVFLDDPDSYRFADYELAGSANQSSWSWKLQSHLDHILVTDELFPALEREDAEVRTLRLDRELDGGFTEYVDNLSDHFPVGARLKLRP